MEYNDLLVKLGSFGKYQAISCLCLSLGAAMLGLNNMIIIFLAETPKHHCAVPQLHKYNLSKELFLNYSIQYDSEKGVYESCVMYNRNYSSVTEEEVYEGVLNSEINVPERVPCEFGWEYDNSIYESTLITQWDIVCERKCLQPTTTSVYVVGMMIGSSFFGWIADRFGRKMCLRIAAAPLVVFVIAACFSPNLPVFIIFRMLVAITNMPFYSVAGVLVAEIVPRKHRAVAAACTLNAWNLGFMLVTGMAYAIRDRLKLQLTGAAPCVLMLAYLYIVDESLCWLYVRGRKSEANQLVKKIARWNKSDIPAEEVAIKKESKSSKNVLDLIKTRNMRKRTAILSTLWPTGMLVGYTLSFSTSSLAGDQYLNAFLGALVELVGNFLGPWTLRFGSRRTTLAASSWICAVALAVAIPFGPGSPAGYMEVASCLITRLVLSSSFPIKNVFTMELYPTELRNVGTGMCYLMSRVGHIVAPYVAYMIRGNRLGPFILMALVEVVSGFMVLLLPETRGRSLPETIDDIETPKQMKRATYKDAETREERETFNVSRL